MRLSETIDGSARNVCTAIAIETTIHIFELISLRTSKVN